MRVSMEAFAACLLTVILAGCNTLVTDIPIGASKSTQTDPRIVGEWSLDPDKAQRAHGGHASGFFISRKEGGYHVVLVEWGNAASDSSTMEFDAVTGHAGDFWFLNAQHFVEDGKPDTHQPEGFQPFLYRIESDGSLTVSRWSDIGLQKVENDVEQGRLYGDVMIKLSGSETDGKPEKPSKELHVEIKAGQKELDSYFGANATQIFTEKPIRLHRPGSHP